MSDQSGAIVSGNSDLQLLRRVLAAPVLPQKVDSSPMARALGTTILELDAKAGRIVLGYEPGELFLQGAGVIQGGAIGGMLDAAMAMAALSGQPADKSVATASMNLHFLKAAPPGRYRAEGLVERAGRRLVYTRALLTAESDGALIATATSVLAVIG